MKVKTGQEPDNARSRRSWPLWPLVLFLILAAVSALIHFEKSRWQKRILAARQQFDSIARTAPIEEVKAQRGRFYETSYYLGYAWRNSYAAADFVRRLSAIIRTPLRVSDLKIVPGWQNFRFELAVEIAVDGLEKARRLFADFYPSLQDFADISQLAFSETAPSALLPGQAANGYVFTISGQAEME